VKIIPGSSVDVGAAIEKELDGVRTAAKNGPMKGCAAAMNAAFAQRGVRIKEGTKGVCIAPGRGAMNLVIRHLTGGAPSLISRALERLRDLLEAALSRHLDQVAVVQSVPLGVGPSLQQQVDGVSVTFTHREMESRRVPVLCPREARVVVEETP